MIRYGIHLTYSVGRPDSAPTISIKLKRWGGVASRRGWIRFHSLANRVIEQVLSTTADGHKNVGQSFHHHVLLTIYLNLQSLSIESETQKKSGNPFDVRVSH